MATLWRIEEGLLQRVLSTVCLASMVKIQIQASNETLNETPNLKVESDIRTDSR